MASLLIIKPQPIVQLVETSFNYSTANVLTPDPKEVMGFAAGVGVYAFNVDFGVPVTIDSVFLGFLGPNNGYIYNVYTATGMGSGISAALPAVGDGGGIGSRTRPYKHHFVRLNAPATSRYWQVSFYTETGNTLGIFAMGQAIQPLWGREWGSGRVVDDRSSVSPLMGGGYGIERGARVPQWQFRCGDLTDAEVQDLWVVADDVGISSPVLVIEDPDFTAGFMERVHWGLFDRPEAYERESPGRNQWSFRVREWN